MLNKYGAPVYRKKNIPCRCSKCGSRKTLAKYPEEYRHGERKCVTGICGGLMRVDRYRLRAQYDQKLRDKDSGKQCTCNGHPRMHPLGKVGFDTRYICEFAKEETVEKLRKMVEDETAPERAYEKSLG